MGSINPTTGSFMLDTPEEIGMYRWLMIRNGLKLKVETGMELTRHITTLKAAQQHGYTDKRTARAALDQMNEMGAAQGIEPLEYKMK